MGYEQVVLTGVQFPNIITRKQDFGASGGKSREGRAAQLTADIAAWQTRFAGSVTLWVSYPDALCTAATDALAPPVRPLAWKICWSPAAPRWTRTAALRWSRPLPTPV